MKFTFYCINLSYLLLLLTLIITINSHYLEDEIIQTVGNFLSH